MFVWTFMAITGLTMVLVLLVVRRRHRVRLTVALVLVTLAVLVAGWIYLIVPPQVPSAEHSRTLAVCPYDRLVWSNMAPDLDPSWQPCRRVARIQLAITLLSASGVTVMAAVMALRKPQRQVVRR